MKVKNRNIPIFEYAQILQKEYLICEFRERIYPTGNSRRHFTSLMGYKKTKAEDICKVNNLPTIWSDEELKKEIRSKVFDNENKPIFDLEPDDEKYYYLQDEYFKIIISKRVGKLMNVNLAGRTAEIHIGKEIVDVSLSEISRIL